MSLVRLLVEKRPGVRYRRAQLAMPVLRRAFKHIGSGTVVIRPLMLQGTSAISLGGGVVIREDAWLAAENGGQLSIGDRTYVGHRAHMHAIAPVSIGSDCVIADNVMITSTDHDRDDRHGVHATGPVVVGDRVFIGQNAVVLGGVTIGSGATVAAGAVVVRDVPSDATVGGVPARVLGEAS